MKNPKSKVSNPKKILNPSILDTDLQSRFPFTLALAFNYRAVLISHGIRGLVY